ncbi:DUF2513 domain-containing protein [Liquorilactobacillus capillatus]|uniref:Transcriptional regulator n=1 Tax=Liquorilactobacillus capillatus DSM 19910 TaxID=1423731 RepID=A0A0R1M0D0_9LACO|nr:DUF2513 domain-containing protein [Liquorilactobacillus capillatus]KRL01342.1 hypothetical protein FC81_GL001485 [Liquorilactobacillus capillatus DSM 19910]
MEINIACIRDLLNIVANKPFGQYINSRDLQLEQHYPKQLVSSTIQMLYEGALIKVENEYLLNDDTNYSIGELTKSGCCLLSCLKDETFFKEVAKAIESNNKLITIRDLQHLAFDYQKHYN